ncbi:hypothetical protein AURDEDRAFT_173172 [Auricularia subglabra TFB-10046 SS5]|nr:hypothetical protein AURDEDRAFT_173172 [Auricularia subglabra TFB-10046 SS5]
MPQQEQPNGSSLSTIVVQVLWILRRDSAENVEVETEERPAVRDIAAHLAFCARLRLDSETPRGGGAFGGCIKAAAESLDFDIGSPPAAILSLPLTTTIDISTSSPPPLLRTALTPGGVDLNRSSRDPPCDPSPRSPLAVRYRGIPNVAVHAVVLDNAIIGIIGRPNIDSGTSIAPPVTLTVSMQPSTPVSSHSAGARTRARAEPCTASVRPAGACHRYDPLDVPAGVEHRPPGNEASIMADAVMLGDRSYHQRRAQARITDEAMCARPFPHALAAILGTTGYSMCLLALQSKRAASPLRRILLAQGPPSRARRLSDPPEPRLPWLVTPRPPPRPPLAGLCSYHPRGGDRPEAESAVINDQGGRALLLPIVPGAVEPVRETTPAVVHPYPVTRFPGPYNRPERTKQAMNTNAAVWFESPSRMTARRIPQAPRLRPHRARRRRINQAYVMAARAAAEKVLGQ